MFRVVRREPKRSRFVSLLFVVSVATTHLVETLEALISSAIRSSAQSYHRNTTEFWTALRSIVIAKVILPVMISLSLLSKRPRPSFTRFSSLSSSSLLLLFFSSSSSSSSSSSTSDLMLRVVEVVLALHSVLRYRVPLRFCTRSECYGVRLNHLPVLTSSFLILLLLLVFLSSGILP